MKTKEINICTSNKFEKWGKPTEIKLLKHFLDSLKFVYPKKNKGDTFKVTITVEKVAKGDY